MKAVFVSLILSIYAFLIEILLETKVKRGALEIPY